MCALAIAAGLCGGQEQAPPYESHSVIVADTEEVSLDLVIRDKKGRAVRDLKPSDLKILDGGSPVRVSDLRMVSAEADSNHLVTLLYDRLDSSSGQNVRDITSKLLKLQPEMRVSYGVFGIRGRMRLLQPYTTDVEAIKLAARIVTGGEKKGEPVDLDVRSEKSLIEEAKRGAASSPPRQAVGADEPDQPMIAKATLAALQGAQQIVQDQHARPALAGLLGLIHAQRELPGRKVIVYFARGWQADANTADMIRSITGAANRAGVSLYTVDANAIDLDAAQALLTTVAAARAGFGAQANAANARGGNSAVPTDVMTTAGEKVMASEQFGRFENAGPEATPLELLAKQTGGECIAAVGRQRKPLERLFEDMAVYYEASYVPPPHESDGQFRPVSVTPVRRGLVVQARSGYFALPPATGSGIRPFEGPLLKLLGAANLPAELEFHARVLRMGELAEGDANALVVEVPMSQIELSADPNTNLYSGHVSIVAELKDSSGAVIEHFSEDIPRHGALELMGQARRDVITMQRHFSASPGSYMLETVVMDRNTRKAGGGRQELRIGKGAAGPEISDVVLVRRETPYNAESDPGEPLRYENLRIVPSLSNDLEQDSKNISLFFVLHPNPNGERGTVELELRHDGETAIRRPLQLRAGTNGPIPYLASLRSSSFEPGNYEIAAIFTQGAEVARRSVTFSVDGAKMTKAPVAGAVEVQNGRLRSPLALTASESSGAPLNGQQASDLIATARARALGYEDSLPSFICVEVTDRSIDPTGSGAWRHRDSMAELLRYHNKQEQRVTLEVNGHRSDVAREDMHGAITHGEFGGVSNAVFRPEAKAEFHWKQTAVLGNGVVQVFTYHVPRAASGFSVTDDSGRRAVAAFHGLVYVDEATRAVRRITLEADQLPTGFVIRSTALSVDYDYVAISSHDYLMPVSGTVTVHKGKRTTLLNEMEFRDYRKYGSESSIRFQ